MCVENFGCIEYSKHEQLFAHNIHTITCIVVVQWPGEGTPLSNK